MINNSLVFATRNEGKMREIKEYFQGTKYHILSLDDIDVDIEVVEDGTTFEENAAKKAEEISAATSRIVLADDSGLVIDALEGEPGVDSANFLGRSTPYPVRNAMILNMLAGVTRRTARFVCVIAIAQRGCKTILVKAALEGEIAQEISGDAGFGYDPIFFLPKHGKTMAQMSIIEKNAISHRGQALALTVEALKNICNYWYLVTVTTKRAKWLK